MGPIVARLHRAGGCEEPTYSICSPHPHAPPAHLMHTHAQLQPDDVLVVNMGPHYTRTMGFAAWAKHVDAMAQAVRQVLAATPRLTIVWRTSFMVKVGTRVG